jgi:pimeloyl-ACP methyl ester carboxylesterase
MTAGPAPTSYLLIHGGATTGRFWDRLAPRLDGPSLAIDLPGRADRPADLATVTVDDGVASILDDVTRAGWLDGRPIVVVAHSSGGLYVPGVVTGLRRRGAVVERIVLSAASIPPEDGCGLDCMKPIHRRLLEESVAAARESGQSISTPGPPEDPESVREAYGGRLDDETTAFMADPARYVTDSVNIYWSPVRWSAIGDVPATYVRGSLDRPVPPALQDDMIARLPHAEVVRLDVGHIPAVTDAARFAEIVHGRVPTA